MKSPRGITQGMVHVSLVSGIFDWNLCGTDIIGSLGWQTVSVRRYYFTAVPTCMYRCLKGDAPCYQFTKIQQLLYKTVFRGLVCTKTQHC